MASHLRAGTRRQGVEETRNLPPSFVWVENNIKRTDVTSFDRSNNSITSLGRWGVPTASLFLLTRNIEGRFVGRHSWNDAVFSMFARTHLEYELQYAKGFSTEDDTTMPPQQPRRYPNHPPPRWRSGF